MNTEENEGEKYIGIAKRYPFILSILLVLLSLGVRIEGPTLIRQISSISGIYIGIYVNLALVVFLFFVAYQLNWLNKIGFRWPKRPKKLWIYVPSLIIFFYNLTTKLIEGIVIPDISSLLTLALFALALAFVEEVIFRGFMLSALIPRGKWIAVLTTSGLFGLIHMINLLNGAPLSTIAIQVGYSLVIGFAFGAMALNGRLLWPLVIAHALSIFIGFFEDLGRSTGIKNFDIIFLIVTMISLVGYGLYLMKKDDSYFEYEKSI